MDCMTGAENAVLFHHPDAVETDRENLMGRHAAGRGFFEGFVHHSGVDRFFCQALETDHGDDFSRRVAEIDAKNRHCTFVPVGALGRMPDTPATLSLPGPALGMYA